MNLAHYSFVDEQFVRIQTNHDESCCYVADHKTMQLRPASTYDLTREDLRDAPRRELESIRQHRKALHNDDSLNDEALLTLCNQQ